MGLDWRQLTWSEYQIALAGWNAMHSDEKDPAPSPERLERLERAMRAHSVH